MSVKQSPFVSPEQALTLLQETVRSLYPFRDGIYHEKLGHTGTPVSEGVFRLVVQCRMILTLTFFWENNASKAVLEEAENLMRAIHARYRLGENYDFAFSLDENLTVQDSTRDLYAYAFLVSVYGRLYKTTGKAQYNDEAHELLEYLDSFFRIPDAPGFAEALDDSRIPIEHIRRQNPHMHFFEGLLFLAEGQLLHGELSKRVSTLIDEQVHLFDHYFFDTETNTLREFFETDLHPHPDKGHILEPGHHFEWAWLLHFYEELFADGIERSERNRITDVAGHLLQSGIRIGLDITHGGYFDEVNSTGKVLKSSKRIWPVTELLKALTYFPDSKDLQGGQKELTIQGVWDFFVKHYLDTLSSQGREFLFWREILDESLQQVRDDMPGTTPYHVSLALLCLLKGGEGRSL